MAEPTLVYDVEFPDGITVALLTTEPHDKKAILVRIRWNDRRTGYIVSSILGNMETDYREFPVDSHENPERVLFLAVNWAQRKFFSLPSETLVN